MYIQKIKSKCKDKEYTSVVLAKNYREDGKVKRKIITTLTDWPESRIEEFQKYLKGGRVVKIEDLPLKQGKSFGAIYVRKERRTWGHMLAYKIMFHIWKWFKGDKLYPQKYILECLDKINIVEYAFGDRTIKLLPKILTEDQQIILKRLNMKLPEKYVGNKFK